MNALLYHSARCFSFRMYILHNSSARQLLSSFYRYQHLGLVRYNNFPFCTINDSAIYFICVDIDLAWVEATNIQMEFSVIFYLSKLVKFDSTSNVLVAKCEGQGFREEN